MYPPNASGQITLVDNPQTLLNKSFSDSTTWFVDQGDNSKKMQFDLAGITTISTRTLTVPDANGTIALLGTTGTFTNKSFEDSTSIFIDNSDNTKKMQFELSGITTATTRTLTVPNLSGIIAVTSGAQTLDFQDSTTTIYDNSDSTKKLAFECSGITTATTRTLTVPNASGTIVLEGATQTLTSKTLTSPTINTSIVFAGGIGGSTMAYYKETTATVTLRQGTTTITGTNAFYVRVGKTVTYTVLGYNSGGTWAASNLNFLETIPSEYRPSYEIRHFFS